tara:strand:+ start:530 stop:931 length:402 start_codon:yes stop_codon:yes gene_type:complete
MSFIDRIIAPVSDLISEFIPDADKRIEFEHRARQQLLEAETSIVEAGRDVIVAEAQGDSWMQRNWRPITMMVFVAIIANNYLVTPWMMAFGITTVAVLEFPPALWGLLTVGIGGYVGLRTVEKNNGVTGNDGQ